MYMYNAFPIPIGFVKSFLDVDQVKILTDHVYKSSIDPRYTNIKTTPNMINDYVLSNIIDVNLLPKLKEFGFQLYGDEKMEWVVKNIWGNIMSPNSDPQGSHNHANCVVSGIIYLTNPSETVYTSFKKPEGLESSSFLHHSGESLKNTPYNRGHINFDIAERGDMILFPSYLKHSVEENKSNNTRITLAFNSFPTRMSIEGWYEINLS